MLKQLRLKFICAMMAVSVIMLAVILGLVLHSTARQYQQTAVDALEQAAKEPGFRVGPHERESMLPYFVIRTDASGTLHASGTVYLDRYEEAELQAIYDAAKASRRRTGEIDGYSLLFLHDKSPGGERYVFVDVSPLRLAMTELSRVCVAVGLVSLALLLLLSNLFARWAIGPVEKAWQQQRQFVGDASHELKTPLTVIMTNAELLLSPDCPEADRQRFSQGILTMSRQMRSLVTGLLELARVDNGAVKTVFSSVDLSTLTEESLLPFEPMFYEKGMSLESSIEPGLSVQGSASHLGQVLEILLDNALKYSAPGGKIWVRLQRQGSHVLLSVDSPGPAIPEAELKNIFKRFYRIDKARSRDGSFGLGLSIAEGIVHDHRGKIWAQSGQGRNYFHIQLPV